MLVYDTTDDPRKKEIAAGAAQDSILGPDVRKELKYYDGILQLEMPQYTLLVSYAAYVAGVMWHRTLRMYK